MARKLLVLMSTGAAWLKFLWGIGMAGLAAASLVSSALAQDKPPTKVVLSLDFNPLGRHAPWYAALAEGYFREEGLEVSIIPSQGTAQTVQAVESGLANIAFVDVPSVVLVFRLIHLHPTARLARVFFARWRLRMMDLAVAVHMKGFGCAFR